MFARYAVFLLGFLVPLGGSAQTFESSDLPIVLIDTGGQDIPDEPKIPALMGIVDNGPGQRNAVTDPPNDYDGHIGIEIRGSSSQMFPKKQYGFETWDANGEDIDVELLGFPEEEDWILHAPYSDKSLMRNVLLYDLAREAGRYASRRRYVEVVLNGEYQGLYILMEKIKRDDNRVDINKLKEDEIEGDDLTGGYIVEFDRLGNDPANGWLSGYPPVSGTTSGYYVYNTPDADEIVPQQEAYIQGWFADFEATMASPDRDDPEAGFLPLVDLGSFVDFVIWQELSRNIDGYRLSTYLYKDKDSNDPRLHAGPIWDFNIALGNANYYDGESPEGFQYDFPYGVGDTFSVSRWWKDMAESAPFQAALEVRWAELRAGLLSDAALVARIDAVAAEVDEAQARNFERWPVLGEYVWPNAYIGETYADEVAYLKGFLLARVAWLDANWPYATAGEATPDAAGLALSAPYPNPAVGRSVVSLTVERPEAVRLELVDARGRRIATLFDGLLSPAAAHRAEIPTAGLPTGIYLLRATSPSGARTQPLTVLR